MGSFNSIGFISNLPIMPGDPAVMIFLVPREKYQPLKGVTYSDDHFAPIFPAIYGNYDDYGKIEDVEKGPAVSLIEEYFGKKIDSIIEEVDDNVVGRNSGKKIKSKRKNKVYNNITFGLEHRAVYEKMINKKRTSWVNDHLGSFWLETLGWKRNGDTKDTRYKEKWEHPQIKDYYLASDGTWSNLRKTKDDKEVNQLKGMPGYWGLYHPYQLYNVMSHLGYPPPISKEVTEWCMFDLSYVISAKSVEEQLLARKEAEEARNEGKQLDYDKPEERAILRLLIRTSLTERWIKGIPTLTEMISSNQREFADIVKQILNGGYAIGKKGVKEIVEMMQGPITDLMRFHWQIMTLNNKYYPSSYGHQEQSFKEHAEMLELYKSIVDKRIKTEKEDSDLDGEEPIRVIEFPSVPSDADVAKTSLTFDGTPDPHQTDQQIEEDERKKNEMLKEFVRSQEDKLNKKIEAEKVAKTPKSTIITDNVKRSKTYDKYFKLILELNDNSATDEEVNDFLQEHWDPLLDASKKDQLSIAKLISDIPSLQGKADVEVSEENGIRLRGKSSEGFVHKSKVWAQDKDGVFSYYKG